MAVRRPPAEVPGVRAHVRAQLARLADRWDGLEHCPWPRMVAVIDEGLEVEVRAWHLPGGARAFGLHPNARVLVDRAGHVRPVSA